MENVEFWYAKMHVPMKLLMQGEAVACLTTQWRCTGDDTGKGNALESRPDVKS